MKFSIITPAHNYGRFLGDAIESVAAQNGIEKEHIVIDAVSTDNTLELLRSYQKRCPHLRWISEPDEGQTDAINKGFRMATGDVVAWLNADEYYLPGTLEAVQRTFEADSNARLVYGEPLFVSETKGPIRVKHEHDFDFNILLYYGCYIASVTTFFHRDIIDAGHFPDPSYRVTMDYEYLVRLAGLGYRFVFCPRPLGAFRWHDQNVSERLVEHRRQERLRVQFQYGRVLTRNRRIQTFLFDTAAAIYRAKRVGRKLLRGPGVYVRARAHAAACR